MIAPNLEGGRLQTEVVMFHVSVAAADTRTRAGSKGKMRPRMDGVIDNAVGQPEGDLESPRGQTCGYHVT